MYIDALPRTVGSKTAADPPSVRGVRHGEHGAEPGFAAEHALVAVGDTLERERLDVGAHTGLRGELQRLFGVLRRAARPAADRSAAADQGDGGDRERLEH